jgi:hypothetical protein
MSNCARTATREPMLASRQEILASRAPRTCLHQAFAPGRCRPVFAASAASPYQFTAQEFKASLKPQSQNLFGYGQMGSTLMGSLQRKYYV